ncbi:CobW family GTP-binding protein [Sodalinema gerasimenkoae]|uniref:CobW family GTP-binding protein n=1 Tax=Sodalinema gerasimenkoae TaxID=2862348 RepID=UPI00135B538D|nr:GTP-binding protein [Sodalinema gerasimenkoae]
MSNPITASDTPIDLPKQGMPVTIITGFLGSGKTTLLNHILNNQQDLKVAVLVNEFGDINIDSQLLMSIDENMVELSNGCICCTINDGLVDAVYRVLERGDRIDHLIIETTGVADPLPIMLTFLGTELRDFTRLDSVLTTIDAETFTPDCFDSEAANKQIIYSDIILLNKTDLVPKSQLGQLEQELRNIKEGARIIRCQFGEVPLPLILDVQYNHTQDYQQEIEEEKAHEHHHDHDHDHEHHHDHDHDHPYEHHHHHSSHLDNDGFVSISFQSDRPLSLERFQNFLDQLSPSIFRAKGILWFQESEQKHIFQLSGKRCVLNVDDWKNAQPKNQMVFIGRHLDETQLRTSLKDCLNSEVLSGRP